jgi:uncharacterized membrane protein YfcA
MPACLPACSFYSAVCCVLHTPPHSELDPSQSPALLAGLSAARGHVLAQGGASAAAPIVYAEGDVRWTGGSVLRFGSCAAAAGFASAFQGVGGGIVIGFLLHEMALLPQVASATVTLITTFSCGSNCVQYFLLGRLPLDWAALFFAVSLAGGWFGQMTVTRLVVRFQSGSLVVIALAVMGACTST